MQILSIQSQVVFGHVGNSALGFPLQRLGHDVWSVPTALLSNHAGYPDIGGQVLAPELVDGLLNGLARRKAFGHCDLVVTGYLGSGDVASVVADAVLRVRAANPNVVYCCDPIIGDREQGIYVDRGIPEIIGSRMLPVADIITPNLFELEVLCGLATNALTHGGASAITAAARDLLARMRPGACCLVTSAAHGDVGPSNVSVMAVSAASAWEVETPRLDFLVEPHGAGDLMCGLFAAAFVRHGEMSRALEESVARVFALLAETHRRGDAELVLVAAGDVIVAPEQQFAARMVG